MISYTNKPIHTRFQCKWAVFSIKLATSDTFPLYLAAFCFCWSHFPFLSAVCVSVHVRSKYKWYLLCRLLIPVGLFYWSMSNTIISQGNKSEQDWNFRSIYFQTVILHLLANAWFHISDLKYLSLILQCETNIIHKLR